MLSDNVDRLAVEQMFAEFDTDKNGAISIDELENLLTKIGALSLLCLYFYLYYALYACTFIFLW